MKPMLAMLLFMLSFLLSGIATAQVNNETKANKSSRESKKSEYGSPEKGQAKKSAKEMDENSSPGSGKNRAIANPCNATTPPQWCN